jgi:hypothetical protein
MSEQRQKIGFVAACFVFFSGADVMFALTKIGKPLFRTLFVLPSSADNMYFWYTVLEMF